MANVNQPASSRLHSENSLNSIPGTEELILIPCFLDIQMTEES